MKTEPKPKDPPAVDYGDATPEDVARALLLHRPKASRNPIKRAVRKLRELLWI